jgi:hypothetical protein
MAVFEVIWAGKRKADMEAIALPEAILGHQMKRFI